MIINAFNSKMRKGYDSYERKSKSTYIIILNILKESRVIFT